ncbi:MAG: GAF domain-containing protein, partial [Candidatus Dormibacterales bacterium]
MSLAKRLPPSSGANLPAHHMRVTKELAIALAGISEPQDLAQAAVDCVVRALKVDAVRLRWWDAATETLAVLGDSDRAEPADALPKDVGIAGVACSEGRTCVVNDYQSWGHAAPGFLKAGVTSVAAVPLFIKEETVGVLVASSRSRRAFTLDEVELLELVAAVVGSALQRSFVVAEKEAQRRQLEVLHEVMVAAAGVLEPRALAELVTGMAADVVGADCSRLTAYDSATGRLIVLGTNDPDPHARTSFAVGSRGSAMGTAFQSGRPVVVEDYLASPTRLEFGVRAGTRSVLAVPLLVRDRPIGALSVLNRNPRSFSDADVQILSLLGAQVAPVIEAASRHAQFNSYRRTLEVILASAPIAVFTLDRHARFTFLEGRVVSSLGLERSKLLHKRVFDLWPGVDALHEGVRAALGGRSVSSRMPRSRTGVDLDLELGPQFNERGKVVGVIGVAVDTSEHRRAQEAIAASAAQSQFLAGMSHELRTPLNSVLGFAQLLTSPELAGDEERRQRYLANIVNSGKHLLDLINDLLDLAKVRSGQFEMTVEDFDLHAIAEAVMEEITPLAQGSGLTLTNDVPLGLSARADRRGLRQVILNLLSNAIKFTPAGGRIDICGRPGRDKVRLLVSDTGVGIAASDLDRIFDEFVQVQAGRTR